MKKFVAVLVVFVLLIALLVFAGVFATDFVDKKKENCQKTLITFSAWGSQSEVEILKPLLKRFEEQNSDIEVKFLHIPQNYFQKLHLLFASRLAPDVVFVNNFYSLKYIKAGLLEDLSEEFKAQKSLYFDKAIQSSSYQNRLYVIPRDLSVLVVYYNKVIFDKYKIAYPDRGWTLEDFLKTAIRLQELFAKNNEKNVYAVGYETDMLYWLPFLFSSGGGVIEDERVVIQTQESVKMLQFYSDLCNKYHVAPSKSQSASLTMGQLFLQGRLAMQISGRWLVPKYRNDANFDWDIVNFPYGQAGSVVGLDSSGYAISGASEHKSEAIRLVKFLSSKESVTELTKSGLIVPARRDVAYSDIFLSSQNKPENAKAFLETIEHARPTPVCENYQKINDVLNKALEPLFLGEKRARDVVNSDLLMELDDNL